MTEKDIRFRDLNRYELVRIKFKLKRKRYTKIILFLNQDMDNIYYFKTSLKYEDESDEKLLTFGSKEQERSSVLPSYVSIEKVKKQNVISITEIADIELYAHIDNPICKQMLQKRMKNA